MKVSIKNFWPVLIIAIFNVALHLSVLNNLEYHRDELLYFSLGQHPDFGYNSVPPMIGWLAWILHHIFGYSLFAVRILPALMSGVLIILIARMAEELGGLDYAQVLAAVGMTVTGFGLRIFGLFQPVHIDLFFWTLCIFLIIRFINSKDDKYLIFFGIAAGLSLLNKYLIGLLFAGFLVIIPFTVYRPVFRNKKFWIGIIAGFLIFLPNLIWQVINGLPVIDHIGELARTQLMNVGRLTFLAEQLMHPAVASVLTIAGLLYLLFNKETVRYRFLGFLVIFVVGSLMLLRSKSYYTIGIYPFLVAAGAVSFGKKLKWAWSKILLLVLIILFTIPISPIAIPILKPKNWLSISISLKQLTE